MFGQGSMGRLWAGSIMDRIGLRGSGSDTMIPSNIRCGTFIPNIIITTGSLP
ncbi:hypothetical protein YC2023_095054 [Brassica napus]